MKTITLRHIPPAVAQALKERSHKFHTSFTRAALALMEEALGLGFQKKKVRHEELARLAGTWTRKEADAFDQALSLQRKNDAEMWK